MPNIQAMSLLTSFAETTAGTPPADAAAWISSGIRRRHIAGTLDVSGVERVQLVDERNQSRVFANEAMLEGIDNPEFPFSMYGHGLGGVTATGDQVATTVPGYQFANFLGHCLGGITRGYSNTVTGGSSTATTVDVTDASNHAVGDFIAIEFATAVTGYDATVAFPRRIVSINTGGAPHVLTLDHALPQAPAADDIVHGAIMVYPDQTVIGDTGGVSGRTWSWLVQKGFPSLGASVRESWVFRGCVSMLQQISLPRGERLTFAFNTMAGSHDDPTVAPWPTAWSSNAELGLAPLSITPNTELWLATDGVTTNTLVNVSKIEIDPGVPRVRTETVTTNTASLQGTAGYVTQPADTKVSLSITPFGIAQWTDQQTGTQKSMQWARLGPAGSGMAIYFPRMSHTMTPKRAINNATTDVEVSFMAHEEEGLGTTELQQAKMVIVLY